MEKTTKQFKKRNAIYECLCSTDTHPSAEMVHEMLHAEHPDISLATVYRNLAKFKTEGTISSVATVKGVERFDANSYLYITRAIDYYDLADGGDLAEAMKNYKSDLLVVSFSSDWLFSTAQSRYFVNALLKNKVKTSFCEVKSDYGHDAFLLEVDTLGSMIRDFLANQMQEVENA